MTYLTPEYLLFIIPLVLSFVLLGASLVGFDDDFDDTDKIISILGFGRVPLAVALYTILSVFGCVGLFSKLRMGDKSLSFHVCLATLCALFLGNVLSRLFAKYLPSVETYAPQKADLEGLRGILLPGGVVSVLDKHKRMHRVQCASYFGIDIGTVVVLKSYDVLRDVFEIEGEIK